MSKIYKTQQEVEKDIKNGVLTIEGDVKFECSINIPTSLIRVIAGDINAGNIVYYAFCCIYKSIKCFSIKARRGIHQKPICLEGKEVEIKPKEEKKEKVK